MPWSVPTSNDDAEIVSGAAGAADAAAILALHHEAGWSTGSVYGDVLVSREGDDVVAAIHLVSFPPHDVLVGAMVVRANRRGRGIGAELMRSAMASTQGVWWLECRRERVAFYRRLGFGLVDEAAVPPDIRATIGVHPSRPQVFMRREVDD
jgi:GNAT superfamily N-acetyltransferase